MESIREKISLSKGNSVYVVQHELGIRYITDEIDGGMIVYDDSVVNIETLEKVIEHYNSIPDEEND